MLAQALGIVAEMTQQLLDCTVPDRALKLVTDTALRVLEANHASLRLFGADGYLEASARSGAGADLPALPFRAGEGVLGWVAATGQPARVCDSQREPRFVDRRERGYAVGSLMSLPVRGSGRTLGVLSVSSPARAAFSDTDEALAGLLAGAAAQALRVAELNKLALTDSQTLTYNRRYLLPRLHEEMERARRRAEPLSLLLFDLDHFKRINDSYGHAAGDQVLCAFADAVRDSVRAVDVMVRRGGEEFVLIMPATDEHQARAVAERIRVRLAGEPLPAGRGLSLLQTVSIGVAMWDGSESAETLEERADLAMYEAKRRGRNRVVVAEDRTREYPPTLYLPANCASSRS
jgi:two-component system cell cycle response regulator